MNLVLRLLLTLSVHAARHLAKVLPGGSNCTRHDACVSGVCYSPAIDSQYHVCCYKPNLYAYYPTQSKSFCFYMTPFEGKCRDDYNCGDGLTCRGYRCLPKLKPAKAPCDYDGNCESNACYFAFGNRSSRVCCPGSDQYKGIFCLKIVSAGGRCFREWNFCEQGLTCSSNSTCIPVQTVSEDLAAITTTPKPISTVTLEEVTTSSTSVGSVLESEDVSGGVSIKEDTSSRVPETSNTTSERATVYPAPESESDMALDTDEAVTTETSTTGDVRDRTSSSVPPETSVAVGTPPKNTSARASDVTTNLDNDSGDELTSIDSTPSKATVTEASTSAMPAPGSTSVTSDIDTSTTLESTVTAISTVTTARDSVLSTTANLSDTPITSTTITPTPIGSFPSAAGNGSIFATWMYVALGCAILFFFVFGVSLLLLVQVSELEFCGR